MASSRLSLGYFHSVRMCIAPTAPSSSKLRRVLPYLQSSRAGAITSLASPPPPKSGPTNTLNLFLEIAQEESAQKLEAVYTDGTVVAVDLASVTTPKSVLDRLERHARMLRMKDEALSG